MNPGLFDKPGLRPAICKGSSELAMDLVRRVGTGRAQAASTARSCQVSGYAQAFRQRQIRVQARSDHDPYEVLGVKRRSSRAEVREAYLQQIRRFHPDVSREEDAEKIATRLNVAYEQLLQDVRKNETDEPIDIFDAPEAEPDCLFVNPFACNVNPLLWRELQAVACEGDDPESCLSKSGIYASESAILYLSPRQLEDVTAELEAMDSGFGLEVAAWTVSEKLSRASRANNRMSVQR